MRWLAVTISLKVSAILPSMPRWSPVIRTEKSPDRIACSACSRSCIESGLPLTAGLRFEGRRGDDEAPGSRSLMGSPRDGYEYESGRVGTVFPDAIGCPASDQAGKWAYAGNEVMLHGDATSKVNSIKPRTARWFPPQGKKVPMVSMGAPSAGSGNEPRLPPARRGRGRTFAASGLSLTLRGLATGWLRALGV